MQYGFVVHTMVSISIWFGRDWDGFGGLWKGKRGQIYLVEGKLGHFVALPYFEFRYLPSTGKTFLPISS